ncbi:uncharacterized protein BCR38DRAFT_217305 [Pseudomassariella vexata]|uniref:Uncharacterized protein n=1 Tax=Pseudomassariella vexata TaxID=1141098 RepID=A0A1Y2DUE0_9PEZI|nr:uncharacterized protein BCR38DRAFT_217305 [Pseudomassariella vexata]ORY62912.1 hypothetical protein BCR38DRAFT_217305 [Pseudomassariella vexata]
MKLTTLGVTATSAVLLLATGPCLATAGHRNHHKRHNRGHTLTTRETDVVKDRSLETCAFPSGKGLVAITPGSLNEGWALSPDQKCSCGSYCPYACPPGQVMAQWKPGSNYDSTDRMAGGLYCDLDGTLSKPFDNKPFCVDGTGTVKAKNTAGSVVSFCQTVLPGNEDIIIPTEVYDEATLAVPDPSYWASTAAHYYINAPGVSADKGCHWGDDSTPIGNWAPYVAGANTDDAGMTFVKLGLNPIWQSSSLFSTKPTFAMKIECPSADCVGLPCKIDGNGVTSDEKATGAGGSDFCVVTVPSGGSANIVVYNLDGSSGDAESDEPETTSAALKIQEVETTTSTPEPSTTSTTSTTSSSTSTSTTPTSTSTSTTPTSTSTSTVVSTTSSSKKQSTTTTSSFSKTSSAQSSSFSVSPYHHGGIFQENGTETDSVSQIASTTSAPTAATTSTGEAAPSESEKNDGAAQTQGNGAIAGLIIALVAAACIL